MPFINVTFAEAKNSLTNRSLIVEMLKEKKINPKEADLLESMHLYAQDQEKTSLQKVKDLSIKYFQDEPEDAYQKIKRFVTSDNKRVAWVIFSRTFQEIPYDDKDPLDDYTPRVSEVLIIKSTFVAIK
ncbi:hypothetical protein CEE45_07230 [Candidatus Heimdallarchaeota archaeon B3_Heim]|nr:MAG: hypothetical protein CEE45_07230 [Candidatus Heimdallarchaeota archaeon B3_Heim]